MHWVPDIPTIKRIYVNELDIFRQSSHTAGARAYKQFQGGRGRAGMAALAVGGSIHR